MTKSLQAAILLGVCVIESLLAQTSPAAPKPPMLPPVRQQAEIQQQWLQLRLDRHLPKLMRKYGVKMWLVVCREYNEDPVYQSLVSPTVFAARRRTIYMFVDKGDSVERLALGGGSNGGLYTVYRDPGVPGRELYMDSQWQLLRELVDEKKPQTIAVNISHTHAFSDGLSAGEWEQLQQALGPENMKKVVRAEGLPLDYINLRLPEMMPTYRQMMEIVHWLIARAFSNEVITPGKTTNQDVVWWLRQQVADLGLGTWFQPSVRVQGAAKKEFTNNLAEDAAITIERGDVLHVDFGITALRLATDTQHMGYVLKPGETGPPPGILQALKNANRMQDIVLQRMRPGRTGNEVLAESLGVIRQEGIKGTVYCHPIGDHGHGAGPLIGLWDRQTGVPGRGDVLLLPSTWYSIELAARTPIPEWGGKELFVGQEEDAVLDEEGRMNWVLRRQTQYHLVR
jgi:Xaa-Pro aminopeptidase